MTNDYEIACLLNNNYRSLLTKQRTYAAFNDSTKSKDELTPKKCFGILANYGIKEVLDPMSGYGTIMNYGWEYSVSTYMVELNMPAHLWQLLLLPEHNYTLLKVLNIIVEKKRFWPKASKLFEVTDEWIGDEGLQVLTELFKNNVKAVSEFLEDKVLVQKLALSLLLPFVMRLSAALKGDAVHIKTGGGVSIFKGYEDDYENYLSNILKNRLIEVCEQHRQCRINESELVNQCIYADAKTFNFPEKRFMGMLTSPPYPNSIDYIKLFSPENYFISYLAKNEKLDFSIISSPTIGTNSVSGRTPGTIASVKAKDFLYKLETIKLKKDARYDMNVYYIPYYANYFYDMEKAYENISKSLSNDFMGYIIVCNNAVRKIDVPVSDFIIETWNRLGFEAQIVKDKEVAHVGSKNPNAKGKMARHTEYIIKVWRGTIGNK